MIRKIRLSTRARSVGALGLALALLVLGQPVHAASTTAADLDYGISAKGSNSFQFDFSGEAIWTAGSQRSTNGGVDPANRRAGRVFLDFQITDDMIHHARAGSPVLLTFTVDSIGQGVSGTPYTDGLDLRYLGVAGSDRSAATLWNTAGVGGGDQADILATSSAPGTYTVQLSNSAVLSQIRAASAGQYLSFGLSNSVGITADPVGNSTAETYGFQMDTSTTGYELEVLATRVVHPTAITQTQGNTLGGAWSPNNLINGSGLSAPVNISNIETVTHTLADTTGWVTGTGTFPNNYFDAGQIAPQFVIDLGGTEALTALAVWGYGGNANEASDFTVEFSVDGGLTWSTELEMVATSALLGNASEVLMFDAIHLADAVRITITDNAGGRGFGGTGPGDRVGFGELRLIALVPEPASAGLMGLGLLALGARRRRSPAA